MLIAAVSEVHILMSYYAADSSWRWKRLAPIGPAVDFGRPADDVPESLGSADAVDERGSRSRTGAAVAGPTTGRIAQPVGGFVDRVGTIRCAGAQYGQPPVGAVSGNVTIFRRGETAGGNPVVAADNLPGGLRPGIGRNRPDDLPDLEIAGQSREHVSCNESCLEESDGGVAGS